MSAAMTTPISFDDGRYGDDGDADEPDDEQ